MLRGGTGRLAGVPALVVCVVACWAVRAAACSGVNAGGGGVGDAGGIGTEGEPAIVAACAPEPKRLLWNGPIPAKIFLKNSMMPLIIPPKSKPPPVCAVVPGAAVPGGTTAVLVSGVVVSVVVVAVCPIFVDYQNYVTA